MRYKGVVTLTKIEQCISQIISLVPPKWKSESRLKWEVSQNVQLTAFLVQRRVILLWSWSMQFGNCYVWLIGHLVSIAFSDISKCAFVSLFCIQLNLMIKQ